MHQHRVRTWTGAILHLLVLVLGRRRAQPAAPRGLSSTRREELIEETQALRLDTYRFVIHQLYDLLDDPRENSADISVVLMEYRRHIDRIEGERISFFDGKARDEFRREVARVTAQALEYERDGITQALDDGLIDRAQAKDLRDDVALMELGIRDDVEN